jgi:hypothetical protein
MKCFFLGKKLPNKGSATVHAYRLQCALQETIAWLDDATQHSGDLAKQDVEVLKSLLRKTIGE